jgi:hypothetical protein
VRPLKPIKLINPYSIFAFLEILYFKIYLEILMKTFLLSLVLCFLPHSQTKDEKIIFTIIEKPGKLFFHTQGKVLSTDLPFNVNQFENDIQILGLADKIFIQASGSMALFDSTLNLIKSVDLKPIFDGSFTSLDTGTILSVGIFIFTYLRHQ